ncbi:winged helix-turn-helix domain-containing protein, partial [Streptomyces sp900105755]|uniref:winged helix-turn-helix domain-containing protein n=1 Tax=Streptomyces sp. 900105755 TaxID=3154389 RepID=UPI00331B4D69
MPSRWAEPAAGEGAGEGGAASAGGVPTAIEVGLVALLSALMHERSSVVELAEQLRRDLDRYSTGGKLPSSRALVERFRVSPVTVSRALAQLVAEGLVVTRPGAGDLRPRRA